MGTLRRNTELGLIILAVVITGGAYTLVGLASEASLPANIGPFLGIVLALLAVTHVFTRRYAHEAPRGASPRYRRNT